MQQPIPAPVGGAAGMAAIESRHRSFYYQLRLFMERNLVRIPTLFVYDGLIGIWSVCGSDAVGSVGSDGVMGRSTTSDPPK